MLFLLTGDIQTGKTRWLQALIERLAVCGVPSYGVVAPGVWVDHGQGSWSGYCPGGSRSDRFEKRGIDNVLLPQGTVVPFARRIDLAQADGSFRADSQSARAGLGWEMSDDAVRAVDGHFAAIARWASGKADEVPGVENAASPGLLVVDEFGRLELMRGEGLQQAVALVGEGPSERLPHAIAVVRETLLPLAIERFEAAWGEVEPIAPCDKAARRIEACFMV